MLSPTIRALVLTHSHRWGRRPHTLCDRIDPSGSGHPRLKESGAGENQSEGVDRCLGALAPAVRAVIFRAQESPCRGRAYGATKLIRLTPISCADRLFSL